MWQIAYYPNVTKVHTELTLRYERLMSQRVAGLYVE